MKKRLQLLVMKLQRFLLRMIAKSETPILIANIIIFIGNCCLSLALVSVTTLHLQ